MLDAHRKTNSSKAAGFLPAVWRRGLGWLVWIGLIWSGSVSVGAEAAVASGAPAATEPPAPTLVATGRAAIYHGDLAGARERAVRAALLRGLERYAGVRIEATTWIDRGELIEREVRAHTHGYVQSFEVLGSRREGDELLVEVRLTVAEQPMADSFRRWLSSTTTLLLVRERHQSVPTTDGILAAALAEPLAASALMIPSLEQQRELASRVPDGFYRDPDPQGVRELGLRWLAGLVVVADADTRSLETAADSVGYRVAAEVTRPVFAAFGRLSIFDGLSGRLLATRRFADHRGADAMDSDRAAGRARARLAQELRGFLIEELARYLQETGFPLRVVVTGAAAEGGGRRVADVLRGVRWIDSVELEQEEPGRSVLLVRCRENPIYVVEELRQAAELEIVHFDAGSGRVEVH